MQVELGALPWEDSLPFLAAHPFLGQTGHTLTKGDCSSADKFLSGKRTCWFSELLVGPLFLKRCAHSKPGAREALVTGHGDICCAMFVAFCTQF